MNDVTISPAPGVTMSSREIADLTGKRHDNVRADIERIAQELSLSFQEKSEPSDGGRPMQVYLLPKRETLILVSGYSITLRAKIIDRLEELEAAQGAHGVRKFANVQALLESLPRKADGKRPNPANLAGITMFIEGHPQLAGRMAWDGLRGQPMVDGGPIEHEHVSEFRYVMHSEDFMAGKRKTRDGMILAAKRTLDRGIPLLSH